MSAQPIPHIGQTLTAKKVLHAYGQNGRDARDEAIAEFQSKWLRYQLDRLNSAPSEDVLRAAGESCCNAEQEPSVTLPEFLLLTAKGVVWIACSLSIGFGILWLCDVAGQYFGGHL